MLRKPRWRRWETTVVGHTRTSPPPPHHRHQPPTKGPRSLDLFRGVQRTIHRFRNHYPLSSHQLSRVPVRCNVNDCSSSSTSVRTFCLRIYLRKNLKRGLVVRVCYDLSLEPVHVDSIFSSSLKSSNHFLLGV